MFNVFGPNFHNRFTRFFCVINFRNFFTDLKRTISSGLMFECDITMGESYYCGGDDGLTWECIDSFTGWPNSLAILAHTHKKYPILTELENQICAHTQTYTKANATHKLNGEIEIVYPRSIVCIHSDTHTKLIVFTVLTIELYLICGSTAWFQFECRNILRPACSKVHIAITPFTPLHTTQFQIQNTNT